MWAAFYLHAPGRAFYIVRGSRHHCSLRRVALHYFSHHLFVGVVVLVVLFWVLDEKRASIFALEAELFFIVMVGSRVLPLRCRVGWGASFGGVLGALFLLVVHLFYRGVCVDVGGIFGCVVCGCSLYTT